MKFLKLFREEISFFFFSVGSVGDQTQKFTHSHMPGKYSTTELYVPSKKEFL
jgi:hypothetical protein